MSTGRTFLASMLYDILREQDSTVSPEQCLKIAEDVLRSAPRVEDVMDQAARDRKIYAMRATMTEAQLAERFGLTVRRVQQIVREQLMARRQIA